MKTIKVTAAIIEKDGKILLAKRMHHGDFGNKWEFPGGKIEPGETPEICLKRELQEELGVDAKVQDFFMETTYQDKNKIINLLSYIVKIADDNFKLNAHEEIGWFFKKDLLNVELAPADVPIASKLNSY